ncbi:cytochrome P450 [Mycobacterium marseillense]|uniref:cytochrome P450 n=1 Tax=Mycobacterium marseillense TaxID=701042 RepID=UPI0011AB08E1|nr:cytochrome P450 [Mycobacterium marseillense]
MELDSLSSPVDLADPRSFEAGQPWDSYQWLRDNDPVHFHQEKDGPGFWAVSRYADVRAVSRDPRTYSSWLGGVTASDPTADQLAGQRHMMIYMDAPAHVRYRKLVRGSFTPRAAQSWQARIDALAAGVVGAVAERGECDLAADVASALPALVVADLMGIPAEDSSRLTELTEIMHSNSVSATDPMRLAALHEALQYTRALAAAKRRRPDDDLATMLVEAQIDGDRLSDTDLMWFFLLLINAGGDTTRNLVGGAMEVLLRRPAQWAGIVANRERLMPTAVEELLRFVSPVIHMRRTATVDTELGGRPIAAGDKVVMFYPSANRDEAVWPDANQLDLARNPNPHLAFGGGGPHLCVGAHIARLEISALIGQLARQVPDIQQDGPIEWLDSTFITGPRRFPVRFTPTRATTRRS